MRLRVEGTADRFLAHVCNHAKGRMTNSKRDPHLTDQPLLTSPKEPPAPGPRPRLTCARGPVHRSWFAF